MNTSLTLSLNQLSSLIGSLAFPDPDGDDTLVHGPGGPRVRIGVLAEVRRVTISVLEWAERLGEQATVSEHPSERAGEENVMFNAGAEPTSSGASSSKDTSKTDSDDCSPSDKDCDPGTNRPIPTHPPAVAMKIIKPAIERYVRGLLARDAAPLPVAAGSGGNPWQFSIDAGRLRTRSLLVAGAQFQFAAEATRLGRLQALFHWGARELLDRGLRGIGHEAAGPLQEAH